MKENYYKDLVEHGSNKINFFTTMTLEASEAVRKLLAEHDKLTMTDIIEVGQKAAEDIVSEHIEIFGTKPLTK